MDRCKPYQLAFRDKKQSYIIIWQGTVNAG